MKIRLKIKIDYKDMRKIDLSLDIDPNKLNIKCSSTMMVICIKQHLSNVWSSIHERVKQHWGWVEKKVLLIKIKRVVRFCCCCCCFVKKFRSLWQKKQTKIDWFKMVSLTAWFPWVIESGSICCADQLAGFYMRATLALNGLNTSVTFCH